MKKEDNKKCGFFKHDLTDFRNLMIMKFHIENTTFNLISCNTYINSKCLKINVFVNTIIKSQISKAHYTVDFEGNPFETVTLRLVCSRKSL